MKKKLLAANRWMMTDWDGNVPEHLLTGNLRLEPWQLELFAAALVIVVIFVYITLAVAGAMPWSPF